MTEGEQPPRRRVENFPSTGMRRFASFDQVAGPEAAARFRRTMREVRAAEDRRELEAAGTAGPIALSSLFPSEEDREDLQREWESDHVPVAINPKPQYEGPHIEPDWDSLLDD